MKTQLQTDSGKLITLEAKLGGGGEGDVYAVASASNTAAKIYKPSIAGQRRQKIIAMAAAGWHAKSPSVAFPQETLHNGRGEFVGFTMSRIGGKKPAHELYSPTDRKNAFPTAAYPFLVRAATNAARSIAGVHALGCVIGDINHSGVLIGQDATVVLIDCDSFQASLSGKTYPCEVGVPEFTPPELQGKSLAGIIRTANHDAFGVAVLIFYTLMMGRHPFAGRWQGAGSPPPMEQAIADYRFAYSRSRTGTGLVPPPNVPTLADLPSPIANAFELAFAPAGATSQRPTSVQWTSLLDEAERELTPCSASKAHHYFRSAKECPWCRMERAFPGFLAFNPILPPTGPAVDIGQLIKRIQNAPELPLAPQLTSLMPSIPTALPPSTVETRKMRLLLRCVAPVLVVLGMILLSERSPGPWIGSLSMVAAVLMSLYRPVDQARAAKALSSTREAWSAAEQKYDSIGGGDALIQARKKAMELAGELRSLAAEQSRRLSELEASRERAQALRFLEAHSLARVKLKGIGPTKLVTLRSFGIETAADIIENRIRNVPGFGPATTRILLDWRYSVESRFKFNVKQPVDPAEVAKVKADAAKRQAMTSVALERQLSYLETIQPQVTSARREAVEAAAPKWKDLQDATAARRAFDFTVTENIQLCVCYAGSVALYTIAKQFGL